MREVWTEKIAKYSGISLRKNYNTSNFQYFEYFYVCLLALRAVTAFLVQKEMTLLNIVSNKDSLNVVLESFIGQ